MSPHPLSSATAAAASASARALQALAGLAEALRTPGTVPVALATAKEALASAELALQTLEGRLVEAMAEVPPAAPAAGGGWDPQALFRALRAATDSSAQELEREQRRIRQRCRWLRLTRSVAVGLIVLCALPLSLDAVREALGVTQECHIIPALAAVAVVTQVALWGARTSQRHLAAAACHQRHQAQRYRRLERDRATGAATGATAATAEATAAATRAMGTLEEVTQHLGALVATVTKELGVGTRGFPASARLLGDVVVALGTPLGDEEGTRRLAQALEALGKEE